MNTTAIANFAAWPPGYRINPHADNLPATLIDAFRRIPVAERGVFLQQAIGRVPSGVQVYITGEPRQNGHGPSSPGSGKPGNGLRMQYALVWTAA